MNRQEEFEIRLEELIKEFPDLEYWLMADSLEYYANHRNSLSINASKTTMQVVDLGLPSGTLWTDRNVGADAPEAVGGYFRWGEVTAQEDYEENPYPHLTKNGRFINLGEDIAGTEYDAAFVNLGKGYKMLTYTQWKELMKHCTREWTKLSRVKGIKVTGPNGNSIFFPASGYRYFGSGSLGNVGDIGYYWSSTADGTYYGRYLRFSSSSTYWYYGYRAFGFTIRPVKNI